MSSLRLVSRLSTRLVCTRCISHSATRSFTHFTSAELYNQEDHSVAATTDSSSSSSSFNARSFSSFPQPMAAASPASLPPVAHLHASAALLEPSSATKAHLAMSDYDGDNHSKVMDSVGFSMDRKDW